MSGVRVPFSAAALDARAHREEDLTLARTVSYRNGVQQPVRTVLDNSEPSLTAPTPNAPTMEASPVLVPAPKRRRVVLPDPVALR